MQLPENQKLKLELYKAKIDVANLKLLVTERELTELVNLYNSTLENFCKEQGKTREDILSYNIETGELIFKEV